MERKDFLRNSLGFVGAGALFISSCRKTADAAGDTSASSGSGSSSSSGSCVVTATETDGPYPLYTQRGASITRADLTESGSKTGVPMSITITIKNTNNNCAILSGALVDIWHCDKDGYYSGYAGQSGYLGTKDYSTSTPWLRGQQTTDSNGQVKFTSIYPGWYTGRMTHIHAQIYVSSTLVLTTQIAFPDDVTQLVYASSLYSAHGQNTLTFATDNVFSDGTTGEMATLTGSVAAGYALTHTIYVAA